MTGRLRLGKISTGIRVSARIEDKAMLMTATRIVIGRRIAALMSHILPSPVCRQLQLLQKRLEITLNLRGNQHRPPHTNSGDGIIGLSLGKQSLGFSNLYDRRQAKLVSFPRLRFRLCSCQKLNRRCVRLARRALNQSPSPRSLSLEILERLVVSRLLGGFIACLDLAACTDREDVKNRKGDGHAYSPVGCVRQQAFTAPFKFAVKESPASPTKDSGL